jgi:hypothetical protein
MKVMQTLAFHTLMLKLLKKAIQLQSQKLKIIYADPDFVKVMKIVRTKRRLEEKILCLCVKEKL